jgi:hypothetical protein
MKTLFLACTLTLAIAALPSGVFAETAPGAAKGTDNMSYTAPTAAAGVDHEVQSSSSIPANVTAIKGDKLSNKAAPWYNYLLLGACLLIISSALLSRGRKSRL